MNTKLTDKIYLEKKEIEEYFKVELIAFLEGSNDTEFQDAFKEVTTLLKKRWVVMEHDFCYDNKIRACWYGLCQKGWEYIEYDENEDLQKFIKKANQTFSSEEILDIPTIIELTTSLENIKTAPFELNQRSDEIQAKILNNRILCKHEIPTRSNLVKIVGIWYYTYIFIPLLRLTTEDNFQISHQEVMFRWLCLGLIPKSLGEDSHYRKLLKRFNQYQIEVEDFFDVKGVKIKDKKVQLLESLVVNRLLNEDKIRADISPYNQKLLEDTQQGHWSLWQEDGSSYSEPVKAKLSKKLVARDPKSSIVNGAVGIDFGTKSTVVVYQKDTADILPMRIGTGDLGKSIEASHYENPTILELNDFESFINAYKNRAGRPFTKWDDLTISHTAANNLLNSKSDFFNAYINELKQWAGTKNRKLKFIDKQEYILDLPTFIEMSDDEINPIEIYAYYLGLYINNQNNGIYLNYILSFPVTYEVQIREKIIKSFERGIKKALPQEIHNQAEEIAKLNVEQGASEPAAYAVVALQEYEFDPEGQEKVFYGVFDFGGGTTDFDFGIFREAQGKKERRYDYAIEHFGAGGDRYLGGENLLELLTFELLKKNKDKLLQEKIQFIQPPECKEFLGSEHLLSLSREAKMNTKILMEKLRGLWEEVEEKQQDYEEGVIGVNLLDIEAKQHVNFELDLDKNELEKILRERIEKGVNNFFHSLRNAFTNSKVNLSDIDKINIFLAGNSSKSQILKDVFNRELEKQNQEFQEELETQNEIFKLFDPLSNKSNFEKPNGKTGVAFGLIETRKSGNIYVIDHNIQKEDNEIGFKYYLGKSRKKIFKVVIDRAVEYNVWKEFTDASVASFEVYYSSQSIVSQNSIEISDSSIKKRIFNLGIEDDNALVYIKLVSPTEFEYVVANQDEIKDEVYLSKVIKVSL